MNPILWCALWLVASGGTLVTAILAANRATQEAAIAIPVFLLMAVIVNLMFIHRIWSAIQFGGIARTSPGKAVGFLLIPFFNIYWIFNILPGWATDYNATLQEENLQAPQMGQGILIAHVIFSLISIPVVSQIVQLVAIYKVCNAVNALEASRNSLA